MHKKLSVIIVNYNVKYFLEQCLLSVRKAVEGIDAEVFVVDNNSVDGSCEMLIERFPEVELIANKENTGFSVANNQAIKQCNGAFVLLLNPDTLVEADTFHKCLQFMDENPDAGGLGVKMVDGKGRFLPESKRGLPTPEAAFYKIFGLSALFPKSKRFGRYHLGYLSNDQIHEIDVLSGAYMLMRKKVLDKVGLLDEDFFMYGEDIDLSWRIKQGGYKNYYFPKTRIIHYKGESTKKGSLNYVFVFYKAMIIFAKKHFSSSRAGIFSFFINLAIYFRAALSIVNRFVQKAALPVADAAVSLTLLFAIKTFVEHYKNTVYPDAAVQLIFPVYILIAWISMYLSGGYDRPVKLQNIIKGVVPALLAMLIFYGLLGEEYRFSRLVTILGGIGIFVGIILVRAVLHLLNFKGFNLKSAGMRRIVVVGEESEVSRVQKMLEQIRVNYEVLVPVRARENVPARTNTYVGKLSVLPEIVTGMRITELIFCSKDVDADVIISQMRRLAKYDLEYKTAPPESEFIIGSSSVNSTGRFYSLYELNSISTTANKRNKRLFDVFLALLLLPVSTILFWRSNFYKSVLKNIIAVISGKKTWVGFNPDYAQRLILPKIKPAVFYVDDAAGIADNHDETRTKIYFNYANNYRLSEDIAIIWRLLVGR
mgnify:CR=1 FL=1